MNDTDVECIQLIGSVVEHCVSSAKGCGFDSQGTHILIKEKCKSLWIKASAKCINVNVQAINTDCKPKLYKNDTLVLQI